MAQGTRSTHLTHHRVLTAGECAAAGGASAAGPEAAPTSCASTDASTGAKAKAGGHSPAPAWSPRAVGASCTVTHTLPAPSPRAAPKSTQQLHQHPPGSTSTHSAPPAPTQLSTGLRGCQGPGWVPAGAAPGQPPWNAGGTRLHMHIFRPEHIWRQAHLECGPGRHVTGQGHAEATAHHNVGTGTKGKGMARVAPRQADGTHAPPAAPGCWHRTQTFPSTNRCTKQCPLWRHPDGTAESHVG